MAHQGVPAGPRLNIPDPDRGVQRPRHHVYPIKLSNNCLDKIVDLVARKKRVRGKEVCASAEVVGVGGG